ncbi:MAG: rhodanese-like domain-containing protein [Desulfobulbaceae bacterium]|nr:rhodanese-like domain-containing protein [Desulfobulbaceae bacterium]
MPICPTPRPFPGISVTEVWKKNQCGDKLFFLDGRSPAEFEELHLGIGEHLIPLGALRSRLAELPADKNAEIICFCEISLRGYEAATVLRTHGYTNVKVMEGGIMVGRIPAKNRNNLSKPHQTGMKNRHSNKRCGGTLSLYADHQVQRR